MIDGADKQCMQCKNKKYLHPSLKCVKATDCPKTLIPAGE